MTIPLDFIVYFIAFRQIWVNNINRVSDILSWSRRFKSSKSAKKKKGGQPSKSKYQLSTEQKEVLVGILLGDGYLERAKPNLYTRIEQKDKQKDQWIIYRARPCRTRPPGEACIPVTQDIPLKDIVGPYMHKSMLYKI